MQPMLAPELSEHMASLVPERHPEMLMMERYAAENNFPIIGPTAGSFCYTIARAMGARRIFELGSGFGYSTAWFARAVEENGGGEIHHVVWDRELSTMARKHLMAMDLHRDVVFKVREAVQALKDADDGFDLIFNDIDKEAYPESLPVIEHKLRPGGVLIIDNMIWSGRIFDEEDQSPATKGVREFTRLIAESPSWVSTLVPIRDGLIVAVRQ
jgi:predicted O-methyltransferase YrrM